jgi:hypothetical protein
MGDQQQTIQVGRFVAVNIEDAGTWYGRVIGRYIDKNTDLYRYRVLLFDQAEIDGGTVDWYKVNTYRIVFEYYKHDIAYLVNAEEINGYYTFTPTVLHY